ncbi:hypothetical protein ColLi_12731 [Colletotrichum liriopes]|uniref:Uncharacterized protein n=1 Tax=Colletotrichum liriopes TaxID=708192 RepID=A0AA37LZY2_9PEZI|nr:hypothetical protein ColLi_12731 [Colletotrichum liriopes]
MFISFILGFLFCYSVSIGILTRFIGEGQPKRVTEFNLSVITFIFAVFTVSLAISSDVGTRQLCWVMKWATAQKDDISLKDMMRTLRSDSALSAFKSLFVGPMRARLAALLYFAMRLGPAFGFALLFGAYTVECYDEAESYPWEFIVQVNWRLLAGGGALAVGLPLVCLIILILYVRKTDGVPRTMLATAFSLSKVIQPLQQHGTMATTKTIFKKLGNDQRFRAVPADINGQFVLEFAPCEPLVQHSPDAAARAAVDLSTEHKGSFLASHAKRLTLPMAGSLLLAIGIQVWLQTVNIRGPDDENICLPMDQIFGYPGARIGLSILVTFYGIVTAAAFEQIMQIYRWAVVHRNPVDLVKLENLFQGHFLFSYWRFRRMPALGGRTFTTGLLSTVVTRLCISLIPPLALLTVWDSSERSSRYRDVVIALTWVTFGVMVLSAVAMLVSTRGITSQMMTRSSRR